MSTNEQGCPESAEPVPEPGLRFVVALRPEADPLIRQFGLERTDQRSPWPIWRGMGGAISLVVSGIGKSAAAGAASWLHAAAGPHSFSPAWINFGIAGHGVFQPGEIRRIHKVTDEGNGRSWYPPPVIGRECGLESCGLLTVDRPAEIFPEDGSMVDMEAAGFFAVAQRFGTAELVQSVKIVSDNAETGTTGLNARRVRELAELLEKRCRESGFFDALHAASGIEAVRLADPAGMAGLLDRFHFTESQRHQLRRLLRRCEALRMGREFLDPDLRDAKAVLRTLREQLSGWPAIS